MNYAKGTSVSADKSRAEIERLLVRFGAQRFISGWDETGARVAFEAKGRRIRFVLPLPSLLEFATEQRKGQRPRHRTTLQAAKLQEQETRRRWRALALVIKAKLEAVESGITTFEDEFLAHIVLADQTTVGEWAREQLEGSHEAGRMPPLLPAGPRGSRA